MKNIQFRIWSKIAKTFVDPEFGPISLDGIFVCDDDYVFQQFTGLKDISGKDIYEGDVLKVNWYCDCQYVKCVWNENHGSWAFISKGQEDAKDDPTDAWFFFGKGSISKTTTEVVGNVFESGGLF